jgi:ABC-2 type transport system permease protein
MATAIRSELLKLMTVRTSALFLACTAGFVLLAVTFQAVSAGGEFLGPLLEPATQQTLLASGALATIVSVVFGALGISGEFRHGTMVPTLLVSPSRGRVVVAKAVAAAVGGAAIGAAAVLAAGIGTVAALALTGTAFQIAATTVLGIWAGTVGASAIGGLFGLGIGGLARNQALAVGAVLLLLLALEPLIGSLVPGLAPWLPSGLAAVIADPSVASDPDVGVAVATYAAYGLVATAAAALVLQRADVS